MLLHALLLVTSLASPRGHDAVSAALSSLEAVLTPLVMEQEESTISEQHTVQSYPRDQEDTAEYAQLFEDAEPSDEPGVWPAATGAGWSVATDAERDSFDEKLLAALNKVRTKPKEAAKLLDEWKFDPCPGDPKKSCVTGPGFTNPTIAQEGIKAVTEAKAFLKKQTAVGALKTNRAASSACKHHIEDLGPCDKTGHDSSDGTGFADRLCAWVPWKSCAENLMFAQVPKTDVGAMRVIMSLIVDDGVPSRGHRTNTFKNDVTHVGIANGGHFTYGGFQCFDFLTPGVNSRCDDKEEPTITCEKATEAPPPAIDMTNQCEPPPALSHPSSAWGSVGIAHPFVPPCAPQRHARAMGRGASGRTTFKRLRNHGPIQSALGVRTIPPARLSHMASAGVPPTHA